MAGTFPKMVKHGHWFKQEWPWQTKKKEETESYADLAQAPSMADKWRLVDLFLQYKGLVTQHIDSYNHFITVGLTKIIQAESNRIVTSESDPKWYLRYDRIYLGDVSKQEMMDTTHTSPHMCRIRDLTYEAPIFVDVTYYTADKPRRKPRLEIGRMPVMLRSKACVLHGKSEAEMEKLGECPYDPGGYFVVKGTEKILMMQEQQLVNRIIVEYDGKKRVQAFVTSSSADNTSRTVICSHTKVKKKGLFMKNAAFTEEIAVAIVFKAMGVQSDMEVVQVVGVEKMYSEVLLHSLQEVHERGIFSQKLALEFLHNKLKYKKDDRHYSSRGVDAIEVLQKQVLSHIECKQGNLAPKIRYLGLMIRRVISAMSDERLIDDRDYYGNKRIELSGQLLTYLFEDQFKTMNAELQYAMGQALNKWHQPPASRRDPSNYPDAIQMFNSSKITQAMQYAISTGNWNIKRFKMDKSGVSQVLSRISYMMIVGSVMRVKTQFEKSRKIAGPRALQPSQWGMLCPVDTPEGEQCGLVKHMSLLTHVTTGDDGAPLRRICYCLGVEDVNSLSGEEIHHMSNVLVFLNGNILGVHRRPKKFISNLKHLRRRCFVGEFVSIYEHEGWNAVFIASDGGRLCRPLIIVANGQPRFDPAVHVPLMVKPKEKGGMNFRDFLEQGVVEWVDVNEENNLLIALHVGDITPDTTHLEIEPLTILGVVSGLIPYPNHNQSPRNTYECAMGKQAMGCFAMNMFNRTDTQTLGVVYPQKPLCTSKTANLVNFHHLGAGQNASVAIMSYSGYDIEDAIIMNRASLDRGFGRCQEFRRHTVPIQDYSNGLRDRLDPPPQPAPGQRHQRRIDLRHFAALCQEGIVGVGEKIEDGYVIANKFSPESGHAVQPGLHMNYRQNEQKYKAPMASYVDRVILTTDATGMTIYKVILRQTRRPEQGDKFASRHGQKGVIGLIVGEEDMPFSETGWKPDLIMNPHGFPSRMTVGKMLELVGSKAACMEGIFANGSAFTNTPAEEIYKMLIANGFAPTGKDYLTSGITGEALESYIFCGPVYYQKLKHMVVDKMHARARGMRMQLTRQPTEGRAKEGGLRVGEMERDCLVAYGASNLLIERLMLSSDACSPTICRKCGLFCGHPDWCKFCQTGEFATLVRMPYACKLLFQEMQSMNVTCRLSLSER